MKTISYLLQTHYVHRVLKQRAPADAYYLNQNTRICFDKNAYSNVLCKKDPFVEREREIKFIGLSEDRGHQGP